MSEKPDASVQDHFGQSGAALTFTQKAFQDVEMMFSFLGGTTPPVLVDLATSAHTAIDTYIDRPEEDKERLKALAVIELGNDMIGHPFLFDEMTRYESRYSPQFSVMAFDLMKGNDTQDTFQVDMALTLASLQTQLAGFRNSQNLPQMDIEATVHSYTTEMQNFAAQPFANTAPRLLEKVTETVEQVIQVIRGLKQHGSRNEQVLKP